MNVTKDTGHRTEFKSGALREIVGGKGRFDLIPPTALIILAKVFERGSIKYEARNWEKGMPLGKYVDSAMRHLMQIMLGMDDEDHYGQFLWNAVALVHTKYMLDEGLYPQELADLQRYVKDTKYCRLFDSIGSTMPKEHPDQMTFDDIVREDR